MSFLEPAIHKAVPASEYHKPRVDPKFFNRLHDEQVHQQALAAKGVPTYMRPKHPVLRMRLMWAGAFVSMGVIVSSIFSLMTKKGRYRGD